MPYYFPALVSSGGLVGTGRTISTTAPLGGGGDLSADRTFTCGSLSTIGAANQQIGVNNAATSWVYRTMVEGQGMSIGINDSQWIYAVNTAAIAHVNRFFVSWSADPLLTSEKILTAGSSVTVRTDDTSIYVDAGTGWAFGTLNVGSGGTNSSTALNNSRIMVATGGAIVESAAITDGESIQRNNLSFISSPLPLQTCEGRLTATSGGTPVTTANVTTQTTLFFSPYKGDRVALYDATRWRMYSFSELSIPLVTTSTSNYDVFMWDSSGTLLLQLGTIWTNDTTRANALVLQNGVQLNGTAEGQMAIKRGRYLGTIRGNSANSVEDSISNRFVWNHYNRVLRWLVRTETASNWTYSSTTIRQANANTANKITLVTGIADGMIYVKASNNGTSPSGTTGIIGIGIDSTTVNSAQSFGTCAQMIADDEMRCEAHYTSVLTVGYHALNWLEANGTGVGATKWEGAPGAGGISGFIEATIWG